MLTEQRAIAEEAQRKTYEELGKAIDFLLQGYLLNAGAVLRGLSIKTDEGYTLITLRLIVAEEYQVSFVSGDTMGDALLNCVKLARGGRLRFQADKYIDDQV